MLFQRYVGSSWAEESTVSRNRCGHNVLRTSTQARSNPETLTLLTHTPRLLPPPPSRCPARLHACSLPHRRDGRIYGRTVKASDALACPSQSRQVTTSCATSRLCRHTRAFSPTTMNLMKGTTARKLLCASAPTAFKGASHSNAHHTALLHHHRILHGKRTKEGTAVRYNLITVIWTCALARVSTRIRTA